MAVSGINYKIIANLLYVLRFYFAIFTGISEHILLDRKFLGKC